jgi:integrase/recombinase XerD
METIKLSLIQHKKSNWIAAQFPASATLNKLFKQSGLATWSHSLTCWLLPSNKTAYTKLLSLCQGIAQIDNSILRQQLIQIQFAKTTLQNIHPINQPFIKAFLQHLQLKAYSSSTIKTYTKEFTTFLKTLGNNDASKLSLEKIKDYLQYCYAVLKLSENSLHSRLNALKFFYEQVLGNKQLFWQIPRPKKPFLLPKVISEEKIMQGLLTIENLKHRTLLLLAYSAGLRVSEVVSLKITDIDSSRMMIHIKAAKGKKDRMATLSKSILPLLRQYYTIYKPKVWLFQGQLAEEHYSERSAQAIFKQAYTTLGLPPQCSFHSLRHSYATHLLENGTDVTYIQKLLGHNHITTTLRYTHVSKKEIGKIESPLDKLLQGKALQ